MSSSLSTPGSCLTRRPNPLGRHAVDKFTTLTGALNTAFPANRVGLDLGLQLADVLEHLACLRPYKQPKDMDDEDWIDQITLVRRGIPSLPASSHQSHHPPLSLRCST